MLRGKRKSFGNLEGRIPDAKSLTTLSQWIAGQFDPTLSWKDVEWVKKHWGGKLILKGILDAEDAKIAAATGVDAIVVSNHGGRQLDGAHLLDPRAARDRRRGRRQDRGAGSTAASAAGQDVLRALALGARGTLIGRAFAYGLGAMGEAGVTRALELIRAELDVTMALCGLRDVKDASPRDPAAALAAAPHGPQACLKDSSSCRSAMAMLPRPRCAAPRAARSAWHCSGANQAWLRIRSGLNLPPWRTPWPSMRKRVEGAGADLDRLARRDPHAELEGEACPMSRFSPLKRVRHCLPSWNSAGTAGCR